MALSMVFYSDKKVHLGGNRFVFFKKKIGGCGWGVGKGCHLFFGLINKNTSKIHQNFSIGALILFASLRESKFGETAVWGRN